MTDRSELVRAIHAARDGQSLARAVAALDDHDKGIVAQAAADREVDLGARIAAERLTPVPLHEHHTAATDWLADEDPSGRILDYRTAMIAEASRWYGGLDQAVREDGQELAEQARGRARTLASAFASGAPAAEREFLQVVSYLHSSEGASGLPQIDQLIDPNNQPSPTPYPAEVFPTFGEPQDEFNGVETDNHASGISSQQAPLIQQVEQQNASGSGFGSGPEKPDAHTTQFDTSDSYAEVPLGPPGTIPTVPAATDRMDSSHPNPVAGTDQDAGADRRKTAAVEGYSLPDPFGYRWPMTTEVMHPFHERCASAHWPDERCSDRSHTASVAIAYTMDLDQARRIAACETVGVREGLRAIASAPDLASLGSHHNRVARAWSESGQSADDTAVLHGFMAVVRPVLAEIGRQAAMSCTACKGGSCADCSGEGCSCASCGGRKIAARGLAGGGGVTESEREHATHHLPGTDDKFPVDSAADVENAKHDIGRTNEPRSKVIRYIDEMAKEYHVAPVGGGKKAASRLDFRQGVADPDHDGDDDSTPTGDTDHDYWGTDGHRITAPPSGHGVRAQGASSLNQVQQVTDPNNAETPQDDQLPEGVMFPIGDGFAAQWVTGPGGAQPRNVKEAADKAPAPEESRMRGRADALDRRKPRHKDEFQHSAIQHGRYLSGWNEVAGYVHAMSGNAPMSKGDYEKATGRGDLHSQYLAAYAEGRKMHNGLSGDREMQAAASRRTADTLSQPHQTTDDFYPPYNSPATTPPMSQDGGDYAAGKAAGTADRAAGQRPAFADNSSGVSPYVKGYAEGYGTSSGPQGAQDVPYSLGGDSGQAANAQQAQQAFQVARASRRRVSAVFAPDTLMRDPEFRRGYLFASKWRPGQRLVSQGSAKFEAGMYAGITDRPGIQGAWLTAHVSGGSAVLGRRIALHRSFTRKTARRRGLRMTAAYLRAAGTTTDLITDGPGTSPDPMGATPLNGPGTPPPMGGLGNPAAPGGAPPYQGQPPLPGGPVVPDDVMGKPQQQPQPSGPFTNTFSGEHPGNVTLAPVAPNRADEPGYSNKNAYSGDPLGGDRVASRKLAAFRQTVQANLAKMGERDG